MENTNLQPRATQLGSLLAPARIAAGSATRSFLAEHFQKNPFNFIHSGAGKWRFCKEKLLGLGQTFCLLCLSLLQIQTILKYKINLSISAELLILP